MGQFSVVARRLEEPLAGTHNRQANEYDYNENGEPE